jgi:hypothetical protein
MAKLPIKVEPLELESGRYVLQLEWLGPHACSLIVSTCEDLGDAQTSATQLYNLLWRVFDEGRASPQRPATDRL